MDQSDMASVELLLDDHVLPGELLLVEPVPGDGVGCAGVINVGGNVIRELYEREKIIKISTASGQLRSS